jgi:hypothetical protein
MEDCMEKWADYFITDVKYDHDHVSIEKVAMRKDLGNKIGEECIKGKEDILNGIAEKKTYITAIRKKNEGLEERENWKKGAEVKKIEIDGVEYIKTEANKTKEDNLGDLPEFSDTIRIIGNSN